MSKLFDDASLAMIPSAYKDGKLYSIRPTDGSGDFTFSRGSNLAATRVDVNGLIEKGRENLLLQSNAITTAPWQNTLMSRTSNQAGYDGSNNAWKIESLGGSASIYQLYTGFSSVCTYSIYAKAGSVDWIRMNLSGAGNEYFDIANGVVGTGGGNALMPTITSIGNGWYKCTITNVTGNLQSGAYVFTATADGSLSSSSGDNVYIQDAQLELGLVATDYIETGTSAAQSGILEDMPRLDYSGSCPSLLLEPQRTNLIEYSEYIEEADQIADTQVLTTTDATPEGTNNARVIAYNGGTNQHYISFVPSVTNGQTYTFSVFLKKKELRYVALIFLNDYAGRFFDLETGTILGTTGGALDDSKIEDYGNGWYRCSITAPATSTAKFSGVYLSDNGTTLGPFVPTGDDGVYIYGYQLEQGSYPTSYIPTYGTSRTRSNDSVTALQNLRDNGITTSGAYTLFFDLSADIEGRNNGNNSQIVNLFSGQDATSETISIRKYDNTIFGRLRVYSNTDGEFIDYVDSTNRKYAMVVDGTNVKFFTDGAKEWEYNGTNQQDNLGALKFNYGHSSRTSTNWSQLLLFATALTDAEAIALTS